MSDEKELRLQRASDRLVHKEVMACVSGLVATLAQGAFRVTLRPDCEELAEAAEQAFDLASPILDYESAAIDAGFKKYGKPGATFWRDDREASNVVSYDSGEDVCSKEDIEPHESEVYEHWIVTGWLADALIERGEKVDKDLAGLTVWARTTTGQAISMDAVIRRIVLDTGYAMGAEG